MSFMRRTLPLLLAACLLTAMLPAAALAADTNPLDPRSAAGRGFPTPSPRQGVTPWTPIRHTGRSPHAVPAPGGDPLDPYPPYGQVPPRRPRARG